MTAHELFQAGRLGDAIRVLSAEVRDHPTDLRKRTFLFELLCFAGEFERAEKHLEVLARDSPSSGLGALLYRGAIYAEKTRQEMFAQRELPGAGESKPVSGSLNGKPFQTLSDADPRVGPRLEVFAAGGYLWIPFEHLASVRIAPPRRLRDLLWIPAMVRAGPGLKGRELGEVLLPVLCPFSWRHGNDEVRLGRMTVWEQDEEGNEIPYGQKLLLVDGEEVPLLEVRTLEFATA
ncbi:MAG: type VI secretion system accessory protein TagJ [Bryobacterales bacterium]|nr:type VI secretion system accessory protein TagJ [Bryobacterales bacterium]